MYPEPQRDNEFNEMFKTQQNIKQAFVERPRKSMAIERSFGPRPIVSSFLMNDSKNAQFKDSAPDSNFVNHQWSGKYFLGTFTRAKASLSRQFKNSQFSYVSNLTIGLKESMMLFLVLLFDLKAL